MSQFKVATADADPTVEGVRGGSALELAALLDPTAARKVLDDLDPEDWCAFGEA